MIFNCLLSILRMAQDIIRSAREKAEAYAPWSRFSEGDISINGENGFDTLQMTKSGSALVFAINGREVWRTTNHRLNSNQFAFWVADISEALIKSYTVRQ